MMSKYGKWYNGSLPSTRGRFQNKVGFVGEASGDGFEYFKDWETVVVVRF